MKKKIEIYILELLLFISIIVFNFIYKNELYQNLSIIVISIYFIYRFGIMKDNNYLKETTTKLTISSILVFFISTYFLGLILGFNKTIIKFSSSYLINVLFMNALLIVLEEIVRYIICRNTPHKKIPIIIYTIILSVLNIIIEINGYDLHDHESFFIFVTTVVIPTISRQTICSYLTYKVSYVPSMIFNLTISLYQYILPIIPNLGNYIYATSNVALPYAIYYTTSKLINYNSKDKKYFNVTFRRMLYIPVFIVLIIMVILVSGIFTHTIVAIGSNSMVPIYERGDAVIYKKTKAKDVKIGEIIAFKKDGRIITHRVINKKKNEADYTFITKGDANNAPDSSRVEEKELLGVVKYRIKYLGYPTLWFNDLYTGKETE